MPDRIILVFLPHSSNPQISLSLLQLLVTIFYLQVLFTIYFPTAQFCTCRVLSESSTLVVQVRLMQHWEHRDEKWLQHFSICQATQNLIKTVLAQPLKCGLMLKGWFTRPFQPISYNSTVRSGNNCTWYKARQQCSQASAAVQGDREIELPWTRIGTFKHSFYTNSTIF